MRGQTPRLVVPMPAFPVQVRQAVVADYDAGKPVEQIARKYGVSISWVHEIRRLRDRTGSVGFPKPPGRKRRFNRERLAALVQKYPGATVLELRRRLGADVTLAPIYAALHALGLWLMVGGRAKRTGQKPATKKRRSRRSGSSPRSALGRTSASTRTRKKRG